jgi:hypothetical protein
MQMLRRFFNAFTFLSTAFNIEAFLAILEKITYTTDSMVVLSDASLQIPDEERRREKQINSHLSPI